MNSVLIGVTGASGAVWAQMLVRFLAGRREVDRIYLVFTDTGRQVVLHELGGEGGASPEDGDGLDLRRLLKAGEHGLPDSDSPGSRVSAGRKLVVFNNKDFFAPVASGTAAPRRMVIVPASMGTVARVAGGLSTNLLERTADVMLKENRPLVLVPRETPLSALHLENLLKLARLGARIVPPMPAYYQAPRGLDDVNRFIVGKVCEGLGIDDHGLYQPWNEARM